jgi:acetyl-CoA carboxylase carboxyl transferase subunit alpha
MLDFEHPIKEMKDRIDGLKTLRPPLPFKIHEEIQKLEKKYQKALADMYKNLSPWQKVQVARTPERPKSKDYIGNMMDVFTPLSGDRLFGEDTAVSCGIGIFRGLSILIMGHEKGHDTPSRVHHNFGMASPEGYRKATRLMLLAERFRLPIVFLVDTPGAAAGTQAEERGQAQAIAECIDISLKIDVPIISVVIGEGGSGGAVAFGTANYIAMLEHSVYSVISPEGCASILWRTAAKKEEAALAQKLTAHNLKQLGVIDEIIPEPVGGAHRHQQETIDRVSECLFNQLKIMQGQTCFAEKRRKKFLAMGRTLEKGAIVLS